MMDALWDFVSHMERDFERIFSSYEKWQVIGGTVIVTLLALFLKDLFYNLNDVWEDLKSWVFRMARKIPPIRNYISDQLDASRKEIEKGMFEDAADDDVPYLKVLPSEGWSKEEVIRVASNVLGGGKYDWKEGKISGGAFAGSDESYSALLVDMFGRYSLANPLHADIFPGARKMEAEIVRMTISLFKGGPEHCGCLTLGGSESLLMACKAMREWGREKGVRTPEIIICYTAHSAFDKAASILGMKIRKVRADPRTFKADLQAMERAITKNTVMLVGSAPQFPHGIIDDIEAIGQLGLKYGIPVHVDCCMGGYLLPFMEAAGYSIAPFDFRVPGVTSISADTHKYGNAPKGSSVIMYSRPEYRHLQYFVTPDWPGGIYATPTIPGSRPGGLVAVCWAALLSHGFSGYTEAARNIVRTARTIKSLISDIPELQLMGDPQAGIVAFTSDKVNILKVGDLMNQRGWHLTYVQYPPGLHICLTSLQATHDFAKNLANDLKKTLAELQQTSDLAVSGIGKVYGTAATIPDKSLIGEAAKIFLTCYYDTGFKEETSSKDI
ncbi:sphingosine-1-phosphate lyase 1-like [Palaemon carinicauda]|uniref:sphingosine-1-phosphate lyase 1-like n=1 Tax=Palaemon carinicauda TaxID=392227 RepID=UPI0035B6608A